MVGSEQGNQALALPWALEPDWFPIQLQVERPEEPYDKR
jgi:hypothetical protein